MKWLLPLFLPSLLSAEIVETTLALTPASSAENTLALSLTAEGVTSSDNSQTSGTVAARIDIDPDTGEISSLELLSGDISATAVRFIGRIIFFTVYDISTSTLGATVLTPLSPAPVSNGQSAAELHQLTINEGTLNGSALGDPIPEQNFADTPVSGTGTVGSFVLISSSLNSASTETLRLFDLDFTFPVDIAQAIDANGISATVTATGNVRATGQASLTIEPPNPYLVWATANGLSDAAFPDNDFSNLLPNGLLWALGYQGNETPDVLCSAEDHSGTFTLELPADGTAADVTVQLNFDLSNPNSWSTVSTISEGTTGTQGPFGGGTGPAFLRLLAEDPAP